MDKPNKKPPTIRKQCGSPNGYKLHSYHKEMQCEECRLAHNAHYREYRKKNFERDQEKTNQQKRERYHANPKQDYEYQKRWLAKYPEKRKAYIKQWLANNPNKSDQYQKKYSHSEQGREAARQKNLRRRLSKPEHANTYTVQQVLDLYGNNCHLCQKSINLNAPRAARKGNTGWEQGLHIDHLIPISKGGQDIIENVRPSHAVCNLSKGAKTI